MTKPTETATEHVLTVEAAKTARDVAEAALTAAEDVLGEAETDARVARPAAAYYARCAAANTARGAYVAAIAARSVAARAYEAAIAEAEAAATAK